jgi:hypothetical protein
MRYKMYLANFSVCFYSILFVVLYSCQTYIDVNTVTWPITVDYRREERKEVDRFRGYIIVTLNRSWLPLSENPHHHPQERTVQPEDAIKDTTFKPGFEIVKF